MIRRLVSTSAPRGAHGRAPDAQTSTLVADVRARVDLQDFSGAERAIAPIVVPTV
jgi:hypothetical protein